MLRLAIDPARGERPLLTPASIAHMRAALARPAAAAVAIEGAASVFCEGLDLSLASGGPVQSERSESRDLLRQFAALLDDISRLDRPVVAVVRGSAAGGGVGVAAAADLVIATPDATFSLPEALMGLIPAVVFPYVARRIGVARARLMSLGAPPLSAEEALRVGMVDQISTDPDAALTAYVRRASRLDANAIAGIKSLAATHFVNPEYLDDAIGRFEQLASSASTQRRLALFAAGLAPWSDADPT